MTIMERACPGGPGGERECGKVFHDMANGGVLVRVETSGHGRIEVHGFPPGGIYNREHDHKNHTIDGDSEKINGRPLEKFWDHRVANPKRSRTE